MRGKTVWEITVLGDEPKQAHVPAETPAQLHMEPLGVDWPRRSRPNM
jgi:hypothetical protein